MKLRLRRPLDGAFFCKAAWKSSRQQTVNLDFNGFLERNLAQAIAMIAVVQKVRGRCEQNIS
jgi:hypothetical protein